MIDPVVIRFAASGVPEVSRAFETVAAKVKRFEEQATRASREGSRSRVRTAQDEEKAKEKAAAKVAKDAERAEKQRTREAEREAKRRQGIERRSSEMAGRFASQQVREETRARQRAAREVERLENYKLSVRRRSAEMAGRAAAREAAVEEAAVRRVASSRASLVRSALHGGGTLGRLGRGAMGIMGATAGIGGGMFVASALRERFDSQKTAALIVNAVTGSGGAPAGANVNAIVGQAQQIARSTGMDVNEILQGSLTYSRNARSGDFAGVTKNMGFFAKLSQMSGANINDLAEAAGTLQSQNADLTPDKMRQLLMDAYAQSKKGSMSFSEAVKQIGIMGATRSMYSGNVADVQRQLIGFGQIARSGGSSEEAGTFVKNVAMEAINADAKFLKAHGKHLIHFDKTTGQMDSPEQVVEQVFRGTKGNVNEIGSLFGIRGSILFGELGQTFRKASAAAGGGSKGLDAGIAAVRATLQDVGGAHMTQQSFDAQHATIMSTNAAKFDVAIEKLKTVLADKLEPWIEKFADKLPDLTTKIEKVIDGLGAAIDFFSEHPFVGLGAVVATSVAADITNAAIGNAVKNSLTNAINAAMGVRKPAAGTTGGGVGIGPTVAAATATAALAANLEAGREVFTGGVQGALSGDDRVAQIKADIKSGKINAAQLNQILSDARGKAGIGAAFALNAHAAGGALDVLAQQAGLVDKGRSVFGGADAATRQRDFAEAAAIRNHAKELQDALADVTKALRNGATQVASNTAPGAASRNVDIGRRPVQ